MCPWHLHESLIFFSSEQVLLWQVCNNERIRINYAYEILGMLWRHIECQMVFFHKLNKLELITIDLIVTSFVKIIWLQQIPPSSFHEVPWWYRSRRPDWNTSPRQRNWLGESTRTSRPKQAADPELSLCFWMHHLSRCLVEKYQI